MRVMELFSSTTTVNISLSCLLILAQNPSVIHTPTFKAVLFPLPPSIAQGDVQETHVRLTICRKEHYDRSLSLAVKEKKEKEQIGRRNERTNGREFLAPFLGNWTTEERHGTRELGGEYKSRWRGQLPVA